MKVNSNHHEEGTRQPPTKPRSWAAAAFLVLSLVVLGAFVLLTPYIPGSLSGGIFSGVTSGVGPTSQTSGTSGTSATTSASSIYNPSIKGGSANVSYPSDYSTLASYALGQINQDRAAFNLNPVILSDSKAGQQHADSMLVYGYFSHWDTQGYKPYTRYTLLGGRGAVEENIAFIYSSPPHFTTTSDAEQAIMTLEHSMMYNDSACCNNGHRDNILTPLHNRVSIGVAYNGTSIYFVEDFENYYVSLDFSVSSSYGVTMTGTPLKSGITSNEIFVSHDDTPSSLTQAQLDNGPREYTVGTIVGGVLPPCGSVLGCGTFQQGITVYADTWKFTSTQLDVVFSLHDFVQRYGSGVYTVYLITGNDTSTAITSISVFVA